ncbi:HAMP domain-containing sensor histidine kinase [Yoonia sp.]|uniref:sensor histidine kinase n=1 Tax=Yoonia sp. TaxID=2212373 RepID=UPI0019E249B4|nr:HAMP domain-containing sensor histidine kinase [Yoonia sp.]MBE0413639.1 HAMP domain-containing histidine kinase [Yoonia sp.]
MTSLRARTLTGGVIWAFVAVMIGVYGLDTLLSGQAERRFDELLQNKHTQVIVALANSADSPDDIARGIGDPAYTQPFSGEYWQIENPQGDIFVSWSLVDALLPRANRQTTGIVLRSFASETGEDLRGVAQWISLDDGSIWHVQVASSLQSLIDDRDALRNSLLLAFGAIVIFGVLGALLQVTIILRPLADLRRDVLQRWDSDDGLKPDAYPVEVAPLVSDINTLLERNREIVVRSRRQAADLAHAIKTPSAIIRNELEDLERQKMPVAESLVALDRLDAHLKRSLARMRADGGNAGMRPAADLDVALGRLARAFKALAQHQNKVLTVDIAPGLRIRMDQNDFEEVMGNLLDNAIKWAAGQIHLKARTKGDKVTVSVADDGPGIPAEDFGAATRSGQRLDTSKPGTGLGLAIADDLAHAYGGTITLDKSDRLGGLEVRVVLPALDA